MAGMETDAAIANYLSHVKDESDFKAPPRLRDPEAMSAMHRAGGECLSCGRDARYCSIHHLLGRAQGGDDVEANMVFLCGDGASGCHGAYHGNPYRGDFGARFTHDTVADSIGRYLMHESGSDALNYLQSKRSDGWISGKYGMELDV